MFSLNDLLLARDSSSTLFFIMGSTIGEAVIPVCIGFIMKYVSPDGMNMCVLVSVLLLIGIYITADWMMKGHSGDVGSSIHEGEAQANSLHTCTDDGNKLISLRDEKESA
jgi:hypothetical protein